MTRVRLGQTAFVLASAAGSVRFVRSRGRLRLVILGTYDLDEYVFDALASGASGFLLKRRAA